MKNIQSKKKKVAGNLSCWQSIRFSDDMHISPVKYNLSRFVYFSNVNFHFISEYYDKTIAILNGLTFSDMIFF